MTSVAVGPASLGLPNMLGPKRYHLQQGLASPTSPTSPTPPKGYETLSKGKKSWSVRLGLSRASQSPRQESIHSPGKHHIGWGTVTGGSVLAQQMIYGEPWLYGTVRGTGSRPFGPNHVPQLAHHQGASVLLVCSCPDFLSGTVRDVGSNCRKCGGHRLAGLAIGGTCRMPTAHVRTRPSLAGMLKPSIDDPYDLMRRSRLSEPRSRARSISPLRQANQRDIRSRSVVRCNLNKDRGGLKIATVEPMSRTEWFECSPSSPNSSSASPGTDCIHDDNSNQSADSKEDDWTSKKALATQELSTLRSLPGRMVRVTGHTNKPRCWQSSPSQLKQEEETNSTTTSMSGDSRKSILECDVNPYLLLKNQQQRSISNKDEDDLSDDLSDNALEQELQQSISSSSSNLFDSSKVKSIERIPNRSSVAAIGGQRIRVFNETREPSDDEDGHIPLQPTLTRIPIPKISPKRPPRRLKEAKNALRSILKRADKSVFTEPKRKSVLFNVDNMILAPEKPVDMSSSFQRKCNKVAMPLVKDSASSSDAKSTDVDSLVRETPIVPEEVQVERPHRFITIPNIKSFKQPQPAQQITQDRYNRQLLESKIVPRIKTLAPIDKIKIDKFVPSKKQQLQDQHHQQNRASQDINVHMSGVSVGEPGKSKPVHSEPCAVPLPETEEEKVDITLDSESRNIKVFAVDEKDMIDKCEANDKCAIYNNADSWDKRTVNYYDSVIKVFRIFIKKNYFIAKDSNFCDA
ncbi:PREDICTED: uncharacterized protein LOC105365285 [Ceratosolen solmsi marchali]|uniref:Uncharacterized protein LOC105365285 n=1 Tax=Ceratosolen solmsi marchali TaxID=326594 RepID=A0AAJ7DZ38_9HYME|nr:PREDICTED: uncharacterized protein LOC105365285 [Ceratosolen solmsi marchali]